MSINDYFIVGVDYGTSGQRLKEITLPAFPNDYLDLCDTHTQTYAWTNRYSPFILRFF